MPNKFMIAASDGSLDIVKFLIKSAADVNTSDKDGQSPLIYASRKGHENIAKQLK